MENGIYFCEIGKLYFKSRDSDDSIYICYPEFIIPKQIMHNLKKNEIHSYIDDLDNFILKNENLIETWIKTKELKDTPLYSSIDIRNSGFKISPIDTNLFPSGFNIISKQGLQKATQYFLQYFSKFFPDAKKIALVSEQFTRNVNYYENIKFLQS